MRQHAKPVYVTEERSVALDRVEPSTRELAEQWLQDIIHKHPESLPIYEIEPVFADAVSLCTEMETVSGFCDNVFVNERGYITIVECKLWHNPEARRRVVAQVLDYAKDIAKWGYVDFEQAVLRARKEQGRALIELMREYFPDIDEAEFIDGVSANLRRARLLLLIVGDGIRENAEELVEFLEAYSQMRFVLSLVEMPIYRVGQTEHYVVTPRILAKTTELRRTVTSEPPWSKLGPTPTPTSRPQTASESVFFERLSQNIGNDRAKEFESFVDELKREFMLRPKVGRGKRLSLNLKTEDDRYNLASIQEDGQVWFYGIVIRTEELGDRQIGIDYLKKMAEIIDGEFDEHYKDWNLCVKKRGAYPTVRDYLDKKADWKRLIENTIERIKRLETE